MTFFTSSKYRTLVVGSIISIITLSLCLLIIEILLRVLVFDPGKSYIRTPGWSMLIYTDGKLPNVIDNDFQLHINSLGIRGDLPRIDASPKIAVLGGSTVEDWVLSEEKTWVKQLQSRVRQNYPKAYAANMGKGGVNARHHLIQLPEVESYMPKFDFFVVLMGLNDFLYDYRIHHKFNYPEHWWREQALMYHSGNEGQFAVQAIFKRIIDGAINSNKAASQSDFGAYMEYLWQAHDNVKDDQWVDILPDSPHHLTTYRETIHNLKEYADKYGAKIIFVTQPYLWSKSLSDKDREQIYAGFIGADITSPETKWYTPDALRKGLKAYNDILRLECQEAKLICVDAAEEMSGHSKFFYDDFHFSDLGARYLGALVGEFLVDKSTIE